MTQGTLTQRQLNRALLARQGLLAPYDEPLPRVLERVGGIQAQYAPSMYVGLWSRTAGFERATLTRALEEGSVVQGTLLRGTIHVVSREDYWSFAVGVRPTLRDWYTRTTKGDPPPQEIETAAKRLQATLSTGALRQAEVDQLVGRDARRWMNAYLDVLRVPPSGTWERRKADLYADAESRLGPPAVTLADAHTMLVRRYLGGFGPATKKEIASWAGLPVRAVTAALTRVEHVTYRSSEGAVLVDLPDHPLPDPDTPAPVRFLPTWDATLLVHARRTQILPEEHRSKIFNIRAPFSFPTFLVDGAVAGTWRYQAGRIELTAFGRLPRTARRELEQAAVRLAGFHA